MKFSLPGETNSLPELWVKPEAEPVADPSCSTLPLEGAGFGNKGLHQGTHLTAFMVPEILDRQLMVFHARGVDCVNTIKVLT